MKFVGLFLLVLSLLEASCTYNGNVTSKGSNLNVYIRNIDKSGGKTMVIAFFKNKKIFSCTSQNTIKDHLKYFTIGVKDLVGSRIVLKVGDSTIETKMIYDTNYFFIQIDDVNKSDWLTFKNCNNPISIQ